MRLRPLSAFLAAAALVAGCGGGEKTSAIPSAPAAAQAAATPAPTGCRAVTAPPRPRSRREPKPTTTLDRSKTYVATVRTNCGTFAFKLDVRTSPRTTASIAWLARRRFFDQTTFHRVAVGYVIQGGDPTATGRGGPGYKTIDTPPRSTRYTKGTVAMAKSAVEPAGTAGSQFFVVTGDASRLPPDYAVIGRIVKGLDVVERIGRLGDQLEHPTTPIVIERFRVTG